MLPSRYDCILKREHLGEMCCLNGTTYREHNITLDPFEDWKRRRIPLGRRLCVGHKVIIPLEVADMGLLVLRL